MQDQVVRPRVPRKVLLLSERIRRRLTKRATLRKTFFESAYEFDKSVLTLPPGTTLEGYFQSWKYFEDYQGELRETIARVANPSPWYLKMRRELQALEDDWIGVHVRRGDYLSVENAEVIGILSVDYYKAAVQKLVDGGRRRELVFFAEDIAEAREFLGEFAENARFIGAPPDSRALESLLLLSQAPSIVCANSSFSWWAAYLGERNGQEVIVPAKWFVGHSFKREDLFRDHWSAIESA